MTAWRQTVLLGRTFFARLFESDLMPEGLPQVQLMIWAMALLAAPGLAITMLFTPKYARMAPHSAMIDHAILVDRLLLITVAMIGMGALALVVWENVFPDRRDARILSPLPVRTSTLVLARLGALASLFILFAAGAAAMPAVLFSVVAAGFSSSSTPFRDIAAQVCASVAASAFPFFLLIGLQCAVVALFRRSAAARVSVVVQILFVLALLQLLALPPGGEGRAVGATGFAAGASTYRLPSTWFVGLFEMLAGIADRNDLRLAGYGLAAITVSIGSTLLLYAASYRRMTRQALETLAASGRMRRPSGAGVGRAVDLLPLWLRGTPVERAVCGFTLRTLARSRQHQMLLAFYTAVGLGVVILGTVPAYFKGAAFARPGAMLGSVTPVLIFFIVAAMRSLFGIPVEPKANWAIRVREPVSRGEAIDGVRRSLLLAAVIPLAALTMAALTPLWGVVAAARHALFCAVMGTLLIEVMMTGFCKVPFTCTYFPTRNGFRHWPYYYLGFVVYAYFFTVIEFGPLRPLPAFVLFLVLVCAAIAALTHLRKRRLAAMPGLIFTEADPYAMFGGFGLSEGYVPGKS